MNTTQPQEAASSTPARVEDMIRDVDDLICQIKGLSYYVEVLDFIDNCCLGRSSAGVAPLRLPAQPVASASDSVPVGSASA